MSGIVEQSMHVEALAHHALVKAKAIENCKAHSEVWVRLHDLDAEGLAYAIATNDWKSDKSGCTREEVLEAVKAALEGCSDDGCPVCESIFRE